MAISESQLEKWSHQGATTTAALTHKSIRAALAKYTWPTGMTYDAYLQGSYPNATNIRGNSDVDLVVETSAVFYSNLTEAERATLKLDKGFFSWTDFRAEVLKALQEYYGTDMVDSTGDKCIKVMPSENRLTADVIPCVEYRRYEDLKVIAIGMTFWSQKSNTQIINYPKIHLMNGASKNKRVSQRYKPSVRMLKNVRENFNISGDPGEKYPSYFLECLFYNAPDNCYRNSYSDTYGAIVEYLLEKMNSNSLSEFVTQSNQQRLFGNAVYQWNEVDAKAFITALVDFWNNNER